MYTLGIPKRQYRRATSVLGPESAEPIEYDSYKQDDGFWQFSFPEVDEYGFRDIVNLLKANGVTTIGADDQLTEKKIMKLSKLIRENLKTEGTMSIDNTQLGGGTGGPMGGGGTVKKPSKPTGGKVSKPDKNKKLDTIKEQGSPDENEMIEILKRTLASWEQKSYRGGVEDCEKSDHYFEDIKDIIEDYEEEATMDRPSNLPAFGGLNEIYNSLTEQDPFQDLYDKQNPNDPKAIPGKHFPDDAAKKRMAQDAASLGKGSSGITKVQKLKMSDIEDEVTIDQKYPSCFDSGDKCLDDVTISWGNESHTVTFELEENFRTSQAYDESDETEFMAESEDGKWQFILDVEIAANYAESGTIDGYDWEELIIQSHPDLDGDDDEDLRLEPETLQEIFKKRAGIIKNR